MRSKASDHRDAVSPARSAAFDILVRVEREASYASELLHSERYGGLSAPDHSLATGIVMGVLRWRSLLDFEIADASSQPFSKLDLEVVTALRIALYQLRYLNRIPAWAAINGSVELVKRARKRSAASFVNAILRKLVSATRSKEPAPDTNSSSAENTAKNWVHPLWLVERWTRAYGAEAAFKICRYDQTIPSTAIRLRDPQQEVQFRAQGIELGPGALLASARIVQRGEIAKAGPKRNRFAVQDEGSQLVAALAGGGLSVLDCCAAPGGKTLAIADRNPQANIVALELHPHRARLLRRLLSDETRFVDTCFRQVQVIAGDARKLPFIAQFERVLADVPCSGTGTLARNPEIKWRLDAADLLDLQARQHAILVSAMRQVAAGGRLLYSTCSLEREENEDVIERALAEDSSFRVVDCSAELERLKQEGELIWPDPASLTLGPYLRTIPGVHPCDGFFAAVLQKI